ncbi:keratin, type I cytoskeletal 18 [Narcine bancroftii]|uniref:keratin, type I cytoskeletal 18 n=1 Tax=Narcine bancroftii TaxID=1343680 RepID=UPI0038322BF6
MPSINSRTSRQGGRSFSSRSVQSGSWNRGRSLMVDAGGVSTAAGLLMSGVTTGSWGEKETMQDLNERLARYLDKVRVLENSNRELEERIRVMLEERRAVQYDTEPMLAQARVLNDQIHNLTLGNAAIMLQIDNARLSADDFKIKLESELTVRQAVENDIDRLRCVREEYAVNTASLKNEINLLIDEILFLKKNHEEEINGIKAQLQNEKVSVSVASNEGPDLSDILAKVRAEYEDLMAKNKADAHSWYDSQLQSFATGIQHNSQALDNAKAEVNIKRQTMQGLEVELETLVAQITGLENLLRETENRNGEDLNKLQLMFSKRESDLLDIRNEMLRNKKQYDDLLKIKITLEEEIAEYRRLINGDTSVKPASPPRSPTPSEITMRKIVKVITTTMVDGKIVDESSEVEEYSEKKQMPAE